MKYYSCSRTLNLLAGRYECGGESSKGNDCIRAKQHIRSAERHVQTYATFAKLHRRMAFELNARYGYSNTAQALASNHLARLGPHSPHVKFQHTGCAAGCERLAPAFLSGRVRHLYALRVVGSVCGSVAEY